MEHYGFAFYTLLNLVPNAAVTRCTVSKLAWMLKATIGRPPLKWGDKDTVSSLHSFKFLTHFVEVHLGSLYINCFIVPCRKFLFRRKIWHAPSNRGLLYCSALKKPRPHFVNSIRSYPVESTKKNHDVLSDTFDTTQSQFLCNLGMIDRYDCILQTLNKWFECQMSSWQRYDIVSWVEYSPT